MAALRALVFTAGGKTQEAKDADSIIVSAILQSGAGQTLSVSASATQLSLQVANTSYLTITSAAVAVANGAVFSGSGASLNNIPAGTALTGQVPVANGGTGVATASANTFFAGPTSGGAAAPSFRVITNADLPTTGGPTTGGLTLSGSPVAGQLMYQTGTTNTVDLAKADSATTSPGVAGYYDGTANTITDLVDGIPASVFFVSGLNGGVTGAPTAEQDVFLSDATAGDATNNAPTTSGHTVLFLGTIKDPTAYNNATGARLAIWPRVGQPVPRA